jgi:hypothetical protein
MFIRRTAIKSRERGESSYTYRLVESVRTGRAVRQHTVLNLGRQVEVPRTQWGPLAQRIEVLVQGQLDLMADGLEPAWEALAEHCAARIVSRRGATRRRWSAAGQAMTSVWTLSEWRSSARAALGSSTWPWRRCGAWGWTSSWRSWGSIVTS